MNDLRTAAQQALERLRKYHYGNGFAEDAECIADLEAALAQQAEPTRSQQMVAAGFKPRDRRLECDDCGGKFTAQMLPIHKCAQQAEPVEPVATLIAQRDALLELLKLARSIIGHPDDAHTQMIDAAIKAVEEGK